MKNFEKLIFILATKIKQELYISVKTLLWYYVSLTKTANNMSSLFNFEKLSKGFHFTVRGSKNLKLLPDTAIDSKFQKNVLAGLLLFSFICY